MMFRSKLYKSQRECYDRQQRYTAMEAFEILKKMSHVKFDESVDVAFKLGIDPKKSDQNVRGAIPLPKGTGKKVTVAVVAAGAQADDAQAAGAEIVGFDDLIEKIKGGWLDFDVLIATPEAMKQVRQLGRVLGPRGLMPNPKTGTVTDAVGDAVKEAKAGRVEFRADRGACVHVGIGRLSFAAEDLKENFDAVINALAKAKPATAKGIYFVSCTVSSTMSPGIRISSKETERR
ncbi:MAG: 50S ribosomal protein L1 [Victivallaceae bacterium]|nr:50S ribosomal protein L1 [Victivallaceae bacterium]